MAGEDPMIEARDSGIHGRGVYALEAIDTGTWIVEYTGERITHEEADRRYDDDGMDRHHTFLFTVDEHHCIDATREGGPARYINHSCAPNCEAVQAEGEIWIVAIRAIRPGEELTYDYGYSIDAESEDEARRRYPCRCGAASCRGTILRLPQAS